MRMLWCLLLILFAQPLLAQSWYEVEVIIFRQNFPELTSPSTLPEEWPEDVHLAWRAPLVDLYSSDSVLTPALRKFDVNDRRMNGDAFAFRVTPGYELLWHQAWKQPMVSEEDAFWILIEGGDNLFDRHELEGSLRIHLSRFLHVTADLWLTDFGLPEGLDGIYSQSQLPSPANSFEACSQLRFQSIYIDPEAETPPAPPELPAGTRLPAWWTPPYDCLLPREQLGGPAPLFMAMNPEAEAEVVSIEYQSTDGLMQRADNMPLPLISSAELKPLLPAPQTSIEFNQSQPVRQIVSVQMNRRMRSGEYHFIDHPLMGMLVRILPVEQPEPLPIAQEPAAQ